MRRWRNDVERDMLTLQSVTQVPLLHVHLMLAQVWIWIPPASGPSAVCGGGFGAHRDPELRDDNGAAGPGRWP